MSQQSTSSTTEATEATEPSFMGGEAPQESKGFRQKLSNIRQEFVDFINRGSVVDLAIGVAVGGAFNTVVNSLVNDIVMPIVGLIAGGVDFNNLAIRIPNFFGADDAATIAYGRFLQACLQFFIIAWVFFLIVKALNSLHRKREKELAKINQAVEKTEAKLGEKFAKVKEAATDSHADNAKAAKTQPDANADAKSGTTSAKSAANTKASTKPRSKSTKK